MRILLLQEVLYEAVQQLQAQTALASAALASLRAALQSLEGAAPAEAVEAEDSRQRASDNTSKLDRYARQQEAAAAALAAAGFAPQLRHGEIQARSREAAGLEARLRAVEADLQRYGGLPADLAAAQEAHEAQLQHLARLRQWIKQGLESL